MKLAWLCYEDGEITIRFTNPHEGYFSYDRVVLIAYAEVIE